MPDNMEPTSQKQVTLIQTDRIRILNPRVRNRRTFEAMVENIARVGLKRPITVAPRVLANCTATWPTPPAAAWIRTVCPASSCAASISACQAVRAACGRAAACTKSSDCGLAAISVAAATTLTPTIA